MCIYETVHTNLIFASRVKYQNIYSLWPNKFLKPFLLLKGSCFSYLTEIIYIWKALCHIENLFNWKPICDLTVAGIWSKFSQETRFPFWEESSTYNIPEKVRARSCGGGEETYSGPYPISIKSPVWKPTRFSCLPRCPPGLSGVFLIFKLCYHTSSKQRKKKRKKKKSRNTCLRFWQLASSISGVT